MAPQPAQVFETPTLYDVSGFIALVTGGGTGIGLMIAQGLASNGAKVYITGRRKDVLETRAGNYGTRGGEIIALPMDATSKASVLDAREMITKEHGMLHVLVNNAGQTGPVSPFIHARKEHLDAQSFGDAMFEGESYEDWATNLSINVTSIFFVSAAFFGLLDAGAKKRGAFSSIINITSVSGIMKLAQDHFCYNTGKAAAGHLTKMLATELALRKLPIRVNAIAPGVYASEMTGNKPIIGEADTNAVGKPIVSIPTQRSGSEAEMAATVLYLVSPAGNFTNGQEIVIDGGFLALNPSTR